MYPSSRRRCSDPLVCQHLWDAITVIRNHKQLPSFERIRRYMTRTHSMKVVDIERHLEECTADNLIAVTRKVGQKGSKVGVEQEGFRLPMPPEEPARHDWYCFECHQGGLVVSCSKCYRVYHERCIPPQVLQQSALLQQQLQLQQSSSDHSTAGSSAQSPLGQEPQFVCVVCQKRMVARAAAKNGLSREELNTLLAFTVHRLKDRLPLNMLERVIPPVGQKPGSESGTHTPPSVPPPAPPPGSSSCGSEPWRAQLLLHHHMDVPTMQRKTHDNRYRTAADLEIDAMTIVHNVCIYHGATSSLADKCRQFLRECQHCLLELQLCADCYKWQHCREDPLWFCRPCNPRHRLVYAKQKGFPYWPAKVMREGPNSCDVRFFGSQHQRANIENNHVRPITTNGHALQIKKTSAYTKAMEELRQHQDFLLQAEKQPQLLSPLQPPQPQPAVPPPPPLPVHQPAPPPQLLSLPPPTHQQQFFSAAVSSHMNRAVWEQHQQQLQHQFQQQQQQLQQQQYQSHASYIASAALQQQYQAASLNVQHLQQQQQQQQLQQQTAVACSGFQLPDHISRPSGDASSSAVTAAAPHSKQDKQASEDEEEEEEDEREPGDEGGGTAEEVVEARQEEEEEVEEKTEQHDTAEEPPPLPSVSSSSKPAVEESTGEGGSSAGRDDVVSSSSQEPARRSLAVQTPQHLLQLALAELDGGGAAEEGSATTSAVRTLLQQSRDEAGRGRAAPALRRLERELERVREEYRAKLATVEETHRQQIKDTKRKQWCCTCESEAIYHCCWNTAYCSTDCQQQHWHKEHKKLCRRKR